MPPFVHEQSYMCALVSFSSYRCGPYVFLSVCACYVRRHLGIHVWCPVLLATNLSFLLVASVDRQCLRLSLGRWCTRLQFEECSGFIYTGRFSRCRYGAYLFCVCVCYVRRRLNIPDCGHHVWSWIFTRCFTVGRQHVGSGIREVLIGATVCP